MDIHYQNIQKQVAFIGAIFGSLLIALPTIASPVTKADKPQSQVSQAPSNSGTSPLNPRPGIFNEPPYNRSQPTSPTDSNTEPTEPTPDTGIIPVTPDDQQSPGVIQPPLPEEQQAPSAMVMLMNGMVNVRLVNETAAVITYQVIGDTNQRSLQGKSNVMLQNLSTPVTVTFKRNDGGLLSVAPQASSEPGMLEVTFTETTDLGTDKSTMRIQKTGSVFLN